MTKSKHLFNDIIQVPNNDSTDNSIIAFNAKDSANLTDEDYIPKPIFNIHTNQMNQNAKQYGFKKRKYHLSSIFNTWQ